MKRSMVVPAATVGALCAVATPLLAVYVDGPPLPRQAPHAAAMQADSDRWFDHAYRTGASPQADPPPVDAGATPVAPVPAATPRGPAPPAGRELVPARPPYRPLSVQVQADPPAAQQPAPSTGGPGAPLPQVSLPATQPSDLPPVLPQAPATSSPAPVPGLVGGLGETVTTLTQQLVATTLGLLGG